MIAKTGEDHKGDIYALQGVAKTQPNDVNDENDENSGLAEYMFGIMENFKKLKFKKNFRKTQHRFRLTVQSPNGTLIFYRE